MSKNESVLCIPAGPIRKLFLEAGNVEYIPIGNNPATVDFEMFLDSYACGEADFIPRPECEPDPYWKQVIPYVTIECGGKLFFYKRKVDSTEDRLRGLFSAGVGGHLNRGDFPPIGRYAEDVEALYAGILAGAWREFNEEVRIRVPPADFSIAGLINHDDDDVGKVHVGIHFTCVMPYPMLDVGPEIADPEWRPAIMASREAREHPSRFEAWTRIVLSQY